MPSRPTVLFTTLTLLFTTLATTTQPPHSYTAPPGPPTAIREAFDSIPGGGREPWYAREHAVMQILRAHPATRDQTLTYLITQLNQTDDPGNFTGTLRCALLNVLLENNDRPRLLRMLSTVPVETNNPDGLFIEFALVNPYESRPLTDILLLFEAHANATHPDVKHYLMAAIRRAFHDRIQPDWSDETVLARCQHDFQHEAATLKANKNWRSAYNPGFFDSTNITPPPLFIPTQGPDEVDYTYSRP